MREPWTIALLAASLACAPDPPGEQMLETASALLVAGEFTRAEEAYEHILERDEVNAEALVALGKLALYGNRFEAAEGFLSRAVGVAADPSNALRALAECHYRQDDFENAARRARQAGEELRATQLESFAGQEPNRILADVEMTSLPFVATDPLPLVRLSVNGSPKALFLIDTGGGELILNAEFAAQVGARTVGSSEGLFAGGQRLETHSGRVDSLVLGEFELRDVPVNVNPGIKGVAGILGTIPLYHFFSTLDYVNGALVLRRKTPASRKVLDALAAAPVNIVVPIWLAGDHMMVARGSVNGGPEAIFFIDTGLSGHAFTAPESTIREAGILLKKDQAQVGQGPAGDVEIVPFDIAELTLGDARTRGLSGLFGPFPPELEHMLGFRVTGLISHTFFRDFSVTLDFERMRLLLQPRDFSGG